MNSNKISETNLGKQIFLLVSKNRLFNFIFKTSFLNSNKIEILNFFTLAQNHQIIQEQISTNFEAAEIEAGSTDQKTPDQI